MSTIISSISYSVLLTFFYLLRMYHRLIMIAEKAAVYKEFPTPLINRLEKHFVLYSSVLTDWQTSTLRKLEKWIKDFAIVYRSTSVYVYKLIPCIHYKSEFVFYRFKERDAFVGYHKDVAAAVVFQASNQLKKTLKNNGEHITQHQVWESAWREGLRLLGPLKTDDEGSNSWQETVRKYIAVKINTSSLL